MTFDIEAVDEGGGLRITVAADGRTQSYALANTLQPDFLKFYTELAADFGTRSPRALLHQPTDHDPKWQPLLTENLSPKILAGYGDPAVLKTDDGWVLIATSNDAPDAFPILRSADLEQWQHVGFAFPQGETPAWAAAGTRVGDFWAPEIARVGDEYWLVYTARDHTHFLRVGLAKSDSPTGPVDRHRPPFARRRDDRRAHLRRPRRAALSVLERGPQRHLAAQARRLSAHPARADRPHLRRGRGPADRAFRRGDRRLGVDPPPDRALLH